MRIVAIEEHHVLPGLPLLPGLGSDLAWPPAEVRERLHASVDRRLADMDAAGIDRQVLSVPLTIAEDLPHDSLYSMATTANSELQGMVEKHPHRFAAFATLPCSTPDLAAAELERAVTQLGFVGAMIFGNVGGRFLDDPMFGPILDAAERLDVPMGPCCRPSGLPQQYWLTPPTSAASSSA
jgi:predicted TIM-barrel fold metal-dependent hydrolase